MIAFVSSNFTICISKFAAAVYTGSSSLMSEYARYAH